MKAPKVKKVFSMIVPETIGPMCEWAKQEVARLRMDSGESADVVVFALSYDLGGAAVSLAWPAGADRPDEGLEIVTGAFLGFNENAPALPSSWVCVVGWWSKGQLLLTRNLSPAPDEVAYKQHLRSIREEVAAVMRRQAA